MAESKSYFTVDKLIALFKKLNLKTDGSKSDLIDESNDYEPPTEISRVSVYRGRVMKTSNHSNPDISDQCAEQIFDVRNRFAQKLIFSMVAVVNWLCWWFFSPVNCFLV